jgi:hypothetical protein
MNRWTILEETITHLKNGRTRPGYIIQCHCGSTRKIHTTDWPKLVSGIVNKETRNLGYECFRCLMKRERDLKIENCNIENAYKYIYGSHISKAKQLKNTFNLTFEEASELYKSNCYYCSRPPLNKVKLYTGNSYNYSGIDRINSTIGYEKDNVVPCCFDCNRGKSNMSQSDYYELIKLQEMTRVQRLESNLVPLSEGKQKKPEL